MKPSHQQAQNLVPSCNWPIEELPGLSELDCTGLLNGGIYTTEQLIQTAKTPSAKLALANRLKVRVQCVNKWVAMADLARLPGVGCQYCGLLLHAGVGSVAQLAQIPVHRLHRQILRLQVATMQRRDLCPAVEEVQEWIKQAQRI